MSLHRWLPLVLILACSAFAADEPPKSLDPNLKVELFAEHPQIVTPTGMDVDFRGRVFAIESNTHFPPEGYKGHPTDRILVMSDTNDDGKADKIVVFTDGLTHSMSVMVRPLWFPMAATAGKPATKQSVYIATRKEIRLFHDDDGDDVADRNDLIVRLETPGNYPHNGLAGFALDGLGWLYFGFGENLGANYKIIGSDGATFSGGAEGGNVYRCRLNGSELTQICTGFWNPHANAFDAFGRLFSVDNDPDSRPPCRLIHVIPGGDYGYRFRNGRRGLHPFTSWDGEVPGTLPMVAGTGEAPSGILAYESDGWPEDYRGNLLVTSWGDHRIDRFRLQPRGTSFTSLAEPVITGGENFRPVGLATAPDGSLFCTDWVLRDYKLHGHGRIWRIRSSAPRASQVIDLATIPAMDAARRAELVDSPRREVRRMAANHQDVTAARTPRGQLEVLWSKLRQAPKGEAAGAKNPLGNFAETVPNLVAAGEKPPFVAGSRKLSRDIREVLADVLTQGRPAQQPDRDLLLPLLAQQKFVAGDELVKLVCSVDDPFIHSMLVTVLSTQFNQDNFATYLTPGSNASVPTRLVMLLAARKQNPKEDRLLRVALNDHDPDVRRVAVQWAAEERLTDLRPRVEAILSSAGMTSELFLATLAALQMLDGGNPADFDKTPPETYVLPLIKDSQKSATVRAQALRLVAPTDKNLNAALLESLAASDDKALRLEAVRTLQAATPQVSAELLRRIAADEKRELSERCEAIVGLASIAKAEPASGPTRKLLMQLLAAKSPPLRREAVRALRGPIATDPEVRAAMTMVADTLGDEKDNGAAVELADQIALGFGDAKLEVPSSISKLVSKRPTTNAEWLAQLNRGRDVDADAGRRTFFHSAGAGCFKCHRIDGRGGRVGPDLSRAVGTMNRVQLIQSILDPSREISPQYTTWAFVLKDGRVVTGMIVHENEGKTIVGNSDGQTIELKTADIEERTPQRVSVMPDKLTDRMTLQELRDLIAFLDAQR